MHNNSGQTVPTAVGFSELVEKNNSIFLEAIYGCSDITNTAELRTH